jgi:hypothetical protein
MQSLRDRPSERQFDPNTLLATSEDQRVARVEGCYWSFSQARTVWNLRAGASILEPLASCARISDQRAPHAELNVLARDCLSARTKQCAGSRGMQGKMQTEDDTLEREIAWVIVRKYRSRARELVLVEPQRKRKDCENDASRPRLVTDDALKLVALAH